ncbi:MAG: VWA domain-containing protein [Dehalococcoidia bacterium]
MRSPVTVNGSAASRALEREVAALLGERGGTLSANLVAFSRVLRAAEFDCTAGRVIDAARSLALIDIARRDDVRRALLANFVTDPGRTAAFDDLFALFWHGMAVAPTVTAEVVPDRPSATGGARAGAGTVRRAAARAAYQPEGDQPEATAGEADLLTVKDFAGFTDEDVAQARRLIRQIAPKLATALSRRTRTSRSGGSVDLRRSLRRSVRHGGEVLDLLRRRQRTRRLRIVLLCDVSGSMDLYARYLVQFMYAVQNELRGVSTFVFSTRLNEITHLLKTRSYDDALAQLQQDVDAWSGGTSIGGCLAYFERAHARQRLDSRTVVVIISDGWGARRRGGAPPDDGGVATAGAQDPLAQSVAGRAGLPTAGARHGPALPTPTTFFPPTTWTA